MPSSEEAPVISFADLAKKLVALDDRFSNFHGNLFGLVVPSKEKFLDFIAAAKMPRTIFPDQAPIALLVGDFSKMDMVEGLIVPSIEDGTFKLNTSMFNRKIPSCDYLCVIAPLNVSGAETNYEKSRKAIDIVRAFFCMSWGNLPFYCKVMEFDLSKDGNISMGSNVVKMPYFSSQFILDDHELSTQVLSRLAIQQSEFKARFERACAFIASAMDQTNEAYRFAAYWIALEILIGKTNAIREGLAKAYSENAKFVDDALHFSEISQIRHNLIHRGIFRTLTNYQERLLQLFFWDVVICQIGLRPRRLAESLANSGMIEAELAQFPGLNLPKK